MTSNIAKFLQDFMSNMFDSIWWVRSPDKLHSTLEWQVNIKWWRRKFSQKTEDNEDSSLLQTTMEKDNFLWPPFNQDPNSLPKHQSS